jgi:hypothetical protein
MTSLPNSNDDDEKDLHDRATVLSISVRRGTGKRTG